MRTQSNIIIMFQRENYMTQRGKLRVVHKFETKIAKDRAWNLWQNKNVSLENVCTLNKILKIKF